MRLRMLFTLLGVTTLLLLASATLAQGPEPLHGEVQQAPATSQAHGRLRQAETGSFTSGTTPGEYGFEGHNQVIDLQPSEQSRVRHRTDEGYDVTADSAVPYARVNYTWNIVDGHVAPYATVEVTVTDHTGVKDFNSGAARWDGWFSFKVRADVVAGDTVYATSSDGMDATIQVITITGSIDADADIVSGTMDGGDFPATGEVEVYRPPYWSTRDSMSMDIDESGNYEADFGDKLDIHWGDEAAVWYAQPDGHQVGIGLYSAPLSCLYTRLGDDWVHVHGKPGNTVYCTVTNELVKGTASVVIEDSGHVYTQIYSGTESVDIEVGDVVEASSEGYLRSVEAITITGLVDPGENTVYGRILGAAEYPADLHVHPWWPSSTIGKWGQTDGSGYYLVDMDPHYDVQMGVDLAVSYIEPDGDVLVRRFSALQLGVSSSGDDFWGLTGPPYVPITLTLSDSGGSTKDQALVYADKDGRFQDGFWPVDVTPGDTLLAETPLFSDTLYVLAVPASTDVSGDVINGTCVPGGYVKAVWIWRDDERAVMNELPTDEDGDFTADFGAIGWDVQVGDYVSIECRIPEGHFVRRGFHVQEYYIYVPLAMR